MNRPIWILALSAACLAASPTLATAQGRQPPLVRVAAAPPLTVTKRSWLDSGNVVAVGTQNSYLAANTTLNQPVYAQYAPGRFGQSTLPGQFDLAFSNANPRGPQSGGIFFDGEP